MMKVKMGGHGDKKMYKFKFGNYAVEKNKLSNTIKKLSKTIEQEIRVKKYLKENKYSRVKGLTKKGNIVILSDNKNIFVNKEGKIQ